MNKQVLKLIIRVLRLLLFTIQTHVKENDNTNEAFMIIRELNEISKK